MPPIVFQFALVVGGAMLKFLFGMVAGYGLGLPWPVTSAGVATGMMLTVVLVSYLGEPVRAGLAKRYRFFAARADRKPPSPRLLAIWARWGMPGIAFFTPLLLTPPGGAIACVALRVPRRKVFFHMGWAAVFWGVVATNVVYRGAHALGLARTAEVAKPGAPPR